MTADQYAADRYKKAKTILDLMMEKLPIATCPFTVQMGEQVARVYYNLGKLSNDESCISKGNELLANEIMRYGGYIRYYQSLSPSQYERLTRTDKFIDQQYLTSMLVTYVQQAGENKYRQLADKLMAAGVNMDRQRSFQESYEQAMQQQMEPQQPAEDASSDGALEAALGGN